MMKALASSLAVGLSIAGFIACGGASKPVASTSRIASPDTSSASRSSATASTEAQAPTGVGLPMSAYEPPTHLRGLKGDGDRDESGWNDGYRTADNDEDPGMDHRSSDLPEGYRDADDLDSLRVGHPVSAAEAKTIEALVRRYYAVAITGNGAKACAMMDRGYASAIPIDYGKFGPLYLRGAKTCAAVVSLELKHLRSQITTAIQFTAVHQENPKRAYALFGSKTTPASLIGVDRENGIWKIGALLGNPEP